MDELDTSPAVDVESMYEGQQSQLILIIGKSGRGKSTSVRTLVPESTFIINILGKPLPFQSGMQYKDGKNMLISTNPGVISAKLKELSDKHPEISTIVIDDAQYIMAKEFMDKAMVKGYEKFTKMAKNFWEVMFISTKLRGDLKVVMLTHEEEMASGERKMKTLGKLLDDKITPEGLSSIVLYSEIRHIGNEKHYSFVTQSDGYTNAKSPFGMFPEYVPNDLRLVVERVDEYYAGVELSESKLGFS